jgi:hypothetical protein
MVPTKETIKAIFATRAGCFAALAVGLVLASLEPLGAQSPPPVQGTIALEGRMKEFYRAANVIIVTTIDGVDHMYQFTKNLVVHGGKGSGVDALEGLKEGNTVVVHYTVSGDQALAQEIDRFGDEGLKISEGKVSHIDRKRKEITIKFENGATETLRMTDRASAESSDTLEQIGAEGTKIIVYYADESGRKVAHYFRKAS